MNISIITITTVLLINLLFPILAFSEEQISALQLELSRVLNLM